jgi:hypothetical protein
LRLRFRRFREDWELFQREGWPVLIHERFLAEPEAMLRRACDELGLLWDDGMMSWPKPPADLFDGRNGNQTFHQNRRDGLMDSLNVVSKPLEELVIPAGELTWLETEFADFNARNGYPARALGLPSASQTEECDLASFSVTRRARSVGPAPNKGAPALSSAPASTGPLIPDCV